MPRKPRIHVPGGFYHVILRGNDRQAVFFDDDDRRRWQDILAQAIERYEHRLHVYCWMSNHVHLAVQAGNDPLAEFMSFLASVYARATNRKTGHSGHLFERRYRAILVQFDSYLKELVRYIHCNPLRAGMVGDAADYPWSSHRAYMGDPCPVWLTMDTVLSLFGDREHEARQRYAVFMGQSQPEVTVCEFRDSGRGAERMLGDDAWRQAVLGESYCRPVTIKLDELVRNICEQHGVSEDALASDSRARRYSYIRAEIALAATEQGVATITEVAKRFGRTQPGLSRAVIRLRETRK